MASIAELLEIHKLINIEDIDEHGNTLAHLVIKNEKFTQSKIIEFLEILLDRGVNVDIENRDNETILQLAIKNRMKEVVESILTRNVNIDLAARFMIGDEYEKFDELSRQFDELDSEIQEIEAESATFIEFLVSKGMDFNCKNKRDQSALCMAFELNLQHILPVLLQSTKDINFVDYRGRTLLHLFFEKTNPIIQNFGINENWYSKRHATDIVRILLDKGVSVDSENYDQRTPIEMAIEKSENIEIVEMLLKRTNAHHKTANGETLFQKVIYKWVWSEEANSGYFMKIALDLIGKGADVNQPDECGRTPLCYAIERHNLHIVQFLRDNGADFSVITKDGKTLMHQLVMSSFFMESGNEEAEMSLLDLLIEHLNNVHHKNSEGESLFHLVIMTWTEIKEVKSDYWIKFARALIAKGADVNESNKYGRTPLWYAIQRHHLHVAEFLRKNGADFTVITNNGDTLMHLLIDSSFCINSADDEAEMALFELLLEHLTNVNHQNSKGQTIFHTVISKWVWLKCTKTEYYVKIAPILITRGANVNEPDKRGMTPVGYAIEKHNLCVVEFLRENGADFSMATKNGGNLMHLLVESSDYGKMCDKDVELKLFDLLLERSKNIQHKNFEGQTVFHTMIEKWTTSKEANTDLYEKIGRTLIAKGADVNEPDKRGQTPLFHSIERHSACAAKFLIENGADFNITTKDDGNLMHLLVNNGDYMKTGDVEAEMALFKLLINRGCQVDARDKTGTTPLHVAAMQSNARVVRMLIQYGAQVNCRNNRMETPLHFATKNPAVRDVAGVLLEQGANVNARDSEGRTALHKIAIESVSKYSCSGLWILFEHGADVNAKDRKNQSVLRCAQEQNFRDYLKQCRQYVRDRNEFLREEFDRNYERPPAYLRNRFDEDDYPREITRDDCSLEEMASSVMICLTEHSVKLKAANLPWDERIEYWHGDFNRDYTSDLFCEVNYDKCMQEIEKLKSTFIDGHTSLYNLLHLDLNDKCAYVNNETLQQLVRSSELEKQFPKYEVLILASCHEAVRRKALLEPSKKAWLELTEIDLPDICIERVFSFLTNSDLFIMIEKDQYVRCDFPVTCQRIAWIH